MSCDKDQWTLKEFGINKAIFDRFETRGTNWYTLKETCVRAAKQQNKKISFHNVINLLKRAFSKPIILIYQLLICLSLQMPKAVT